MFTITIVSDEPVLRAGLRALLGQSSEFELAGMCENALQLAVIAQQSNPDLILYALRPETEIALADLRHASPRSMIIVLARDFSPEFAHPALEQGIRGFISTTTPPQVLEECLRTVACGELWMEKSLSMRLLDRRPVKLSRRQTQVIRLLAQGLKNKEIATALGIAEGTVKAYMTVLFEKLGAKDRFELALFGLKNFKGFQEEDPVRTTVPMRPVQRPLVRRTVA